MTITKSAVQVAITIALLLISFEKLQVAIATCTYIIGRSEFQNECLNLTQALELIQDNVEVMLEPGEHFLPSTDSTSILIKNLSGVSIIGLSENSNDVNITCGDGIRIGFAFSGINQLTLANLTLKGCAINEKQMGMVQAYSASSFKEVVLIPSDIGIGIFIGNCYNVTIDNLVISNTEGIGMLGVNILADSRFSNVRFEKNKPMDSHCFEMSPTSNKSSVASVGGGLYVLYQDNNQSVTTLGNQNLKITNCHFINNRDCSNNWVTEMYYEYSSRLQSEGYSVGGGGGLTIIMAQKRYDVHTVIQNSRFLSNVAKFGSGAHVGLFTGVCNSSVNFDDCLFADNGHPEKPSPYSGGGMNIIFNLVRPVQTQTNFTDSVLTCHSTLTLSKTSFIKNYALFGGGLYVHSLSGQRHDMMNGPDVNIIQCNFLQNQATVASGAIVLTRRGDIFNTGIAVDITDSTFDENISQFESGDNMVAISGVNFLVVRSGTLTISGRTTFSNNMGTAIASSSTPIKINGVITIANNTGFAGALRLTDLATLTLCRNSRLFFSNNNFFPNGGAVYVGSQGPHPRYFQGDCFLYFEEANTLSLNPKCPNFDLLNVTIMFEGNNAVLGNILYGATLESCSWIHCLKNFTEESKTVYQILEEWEIISINDERNLSMSDSRILSTPSSQFLLVNYTQEHVMPGQTFNISVVVLDSFNQTISDGLGSAVIEREFERINVNTATSLGPNGFWYVDRSPIDVGSFTPVSVVGSQNQTVTIILSSTDSLSSAYYTFKVTLTSCELGFHYDNVSRRCLCNLNFSEAGVLCNNNTGKLTLPENLWLGSVNEGASSLFGYTSCPVGYCRPGAINITKGNFQYRCAERLNRNGVGCGGCEVNFSSSFGSSQCQECSNYYLFLIFAFAFAGFVTMFGMASLHITITEGYLNSVLFYSNIANLFDAYFTPLSIGSGFFIPVSWISQNLGIQTCFYDGMTTLDAYALRFAYIAYLFLLMGIVSLVARYFSLPRSYKYSPTKVFATLLILCYSSLLETCVSIFAFTSVYTSDGNVLTRWYYDPNVVYVQGLHGFLFALSIVIMMLFIIPFPLLILSPKILLRMKIFSRFKPLLDAFWAPLKPKFEWWISFRLVFRLIPVCLSSSFVPTPTNIFVLGISLVILLYVQMKSQPFQRSLQNAIDDLLLTNLVLLMIGYVYFSSRDDSNGIIIYSAVMLGTAYVTFIFVSLIHFDLRFPNVRGKILQYVSRQKNKNSSIDLPGPLELPETSHKDIVTHTEVTVSPRDKNRSSAHFAAPDASEGLADLKFSRYRESLLEDSTSDDGESRGNLKDRIANAIMDSSEKLSF